MMKKDLKYIYIYIYIYIYKTESLCVHLKLTQHCKLAILQFKNKLIELKQSAINFHKILKPVMLVLSRVWNFVTLWTVACQAALSMGCFRQKSWSRLPFFSSKASSQPRDWTHVPCMSCIAGRFFTRWAIREAPRPVYISSERILSISWTL